MRQRRPSNSPCFLSTFQPPAPLSGVGWRLTPLHPDLNAVDFAAWRSCRARLRHELQWNGWPSDGFTLEDNRDDLAEHYREFVANTAWAYSILCDDACIGCIYIEPWEEGAQVAWWLVADWLPQESEVVKTVMGWLDDRWPLGRVIWPVRLENERAIGILEGLGLVRTPGTDDHQSYARPPAS
jgi:RimJ/RimL family protein N-acetyltransferase